METTLHQQLKAHYQQHSSSTEAQLGSYRIDVRLPDRLIEIQCSALAALRDKVNELCQEHPVTVVKPIIARKQITTLKWNRVVGTTHSRHIGSWLDLFDELVHFTRTFPQPNLTLEILLIDIEERRRPGRKRTRKGYRVDDRSLRQIHGIRTLRLATDLYRLLPAELPDEFTTADLAAALGIHRNSAQKIAYCLRECGAAEVVGKQRNAILYRPLTRQEELAKAA